MQSETTAIDQTRAIIRRNPNVTAEELKTELALSNLGMAKNLLNLARKKEADMVDQLARQDDAAVDALVTGTTEVPPKLYLRDRDTGTVFELEILKETADKVIFRTVFEDTSLKRVAKF